MGDIRMHARTFQSGQGVGKGCLRLPQIGFGPGKGEELPVTSRQPALVPESGKALPGA